MHETSEITDNILDQHFEECSPKYVPFNLMYFTLLSTPYPHKVLYKYLKKVPLGLSYFKVRYLKVSNPIGLK